MADRQASPQSLYCFLKTRLGGLRGAQKAVGHFQQHLLDDVTAVMANSVATRPPVRPNPFNLNDWSQPEASADAPPHADSRRLCDATMLCTSAH